MSSLCGLQGNRAPSRLPYVKHALESTEHEEALANVVSVTDLSPGATKCVWSRLDGVTYHVDDDSCEDRSRDGHAVLGVLHATDEFLVAGTVQSADDAKNDDSEDRDHGAI